MAIHGDTPPDAVIEDLPKKVRIAAAWNLDKNFHQGRAADALDVSGEYIRQVIADLELGDGEREKLTEDDIERAKSREVETAVYQVMREHNAFRGLPDVKDVVEVDRDAVEDEVERLRVLEQSAEAAGDGERAFVARTAREFLEEQVLHQED